MSDSALVNRAARLLSLVSPRTPLEAVLRRELTPRRDLSPAERRHIVRALNAAFRWQGWIEPGTPVQQRIQEALTWQGRFDAAAIKSEALAARAVPAWAWEELVFEDQDSKSAWLRHLQRDPTLWIRTRREAAASIPGLLGDCQPVPAGFVEAFGPAPTAFRYAGARDLFLTPGFREGRFEIQDLASQLVGHACAPKPGETWWDACAGEGGKMLHLADLMENKGLIWASDRSARRLAILRQRAARARVFNYRAVAWDGGRHPPTRTRFDGVLVDAPCSGVGTWQRHPQARWTTAPRDVAELAAVQRRLLDCAAGALKPGGRLVYSVCTLTRSETTGLAEAFAAAHPELEPVDVFAPQAGAAPGSRHSATLWPHVLDSNGMFLAAWRRKP